MKVEAMDTLTATNILFENNGGGIRQQQQQGFPQMDFVSNSPGSAGMMKGHQGLGLGAGAPVPATSSSSTDEMMMDLFNGSDIDLLQGLDFES